jgi:hypothetical protein
MAWITLTGSCLGKGFENALEEALRGLAGSWTIHGSEGLVGGWCVMLFRRDDGFERTVLLSPTEQTPTLIREIVKDAFRVVPSRAGSREARLPPGVNQDRRESPRR